MACAKRWATATRARLCPILGLRLSYFASNALPLVRVADQAHSVSVARNHGLPCVVCRLLCLPALSLLPGQTPPHELRCPASGNCFMSDPVSANRFPAASSLI